MGDAFTFQNFHGTNFVRRTWNSVNNSTKLLASLVLVLSATAVLVFLLVDENVKERTHKTVQPDADFCGLNKNPCENGGTCLNLAESYTCACSPGYKGQKCEIEKDECADSQHCLNGGTCVDELNRYSCTCAQGFEGELCESPATKCGEYKKTHVQGQGDSKIISLDCGGLISPDPKEPIILDYKSFQNYRNGSRCLWTLDYRQNSIQIDVKLKIELLCDGFSSSDSMALSIIEWREGNGKDLTSSVLNNEAYTSPRFLIRSHLSFISTRKSLAYGTGFMIRATVLHTQTSRYPGLNSVHTNSPGSASYDRLTPGPAIFIVVNPTPATEQTFLSVNYVDVGPLRAFETCRNSFIKSIDIWEMSLSGPPSRLARLCGKDENFPTVYETEFPILALFWWEKNGRGLNISWV